MAQRDRARETAARAARNDAVFREANERIDRFARSVYGDGGVRSCTDRFQIEIAAYAELRADPTLFVVKPGHDLPETETVVAKNENFWTVQKDPGVPAAIARATDPT